MSGQNEAIYIFRSFPGLFRKEARGKRRFERFARPEKSFVVNFFLLDEQCSKTPRGPEELKLTLAGLEKRSLTVTSNINHSEVCRLKDNALIFSCLMNPAHPFPFTKVH